MKTSLSSKQSYGRTFDKVDNQTFGDTLRKLSQLLMKKSQSGSNRILRDGQLTARQLSKYAWVIESFWPNAIPDANYSYGLRKKRWNLETASAVVEFLPP